MSFVPLFVINNKPLTLEELETLLNDASIWKEKYYQEQRNNDSWKGTYEALKRDYTNLERRYQIQVDDNMVLSEKLIHYQEEQKINTNVWLTGYNDGQVKAKQALRVNNAYT